MGDGIINLTNIGWILSLSIAYYGTVKYKDVPPEKKEKLETLLTRLGVISPAYIVVGLWLWMRFIWALGWQLQLELIMVIFTCNYAYRQVGRVKKQFVYQLHKELTESKDPTQLLGNNLPEWVTFPSANRVQWLNTTIQSLWPSIEAAMNNSIRNAVEPILERTKPSFVYGFKIRNASIGKVPIVLNGVQHHQYGTNETTLDLSVSWDAKMDVRLLVQVPGPDMEVLMSDLAARMTLRVTMGPHIPQWPCFANMAISIVGTPEMDFNFNAGKISLDSVPGLGNWLDNFIRYTLVGMMAYPKGIVVPIVKGYKLDMGRAAGALGTLKIKFLRIDNLLSKFKKYKKTPFYCKIAQVESEKKRMRGKSYTGFDSKLTDVFSYILYDNTGTMRVWLFFDVVGADICVGSYDIPTKTLIESGDSEVELMMIKDSDPSNTRRGSVFVKAEFLPFASHDADGSPKTDPPPGDPTRKTSPEFIQEMAAEGRAPSVPQSRSVTPRNSISGAMTGSGSLFVTVVSAANLKNREKVSISDPYVFLRVNGSTAKSKYINSNLNPVFNFDAELSVNDADTDVLKVSVIDKNDMGADKLMGYTEIPITNISKSRNEMLSGNFDLDPQGSVNMKLSFLHHN